MTDLDGVGPARARAFEALGVHDVADLLFLAPLALESGSDVTSIREAAARRGALVHVEGSVAKTSLRRFGRRSTLSVTVTDESGSIVALFFNQPWLHKRFVVGERVSLLGKVVDSKGPALASPRLGSSGRPLAKAGDVTPLYPSAEGVGASLVARLCRDVAERFAARVQEPVARERLRALSIPDLSAAVRGLHAPSSDHEFQAARRRLALENLLVLQARLVERRRAAAAGRALVAAVDDDADRAIRAAFPFALTVAQARVASELRADLARTQPMRRLLQGDVGSGKTALGAYAAFVVARSAGQTAFLAPTELLAEQHFDGLRPLLERAGLRPALLTGSLTASERRQVLALVESGMADVVFGTHALFSADVRYRRLALCVVDEQHRFGVAQRARLLDKGRDAHALLMTATPIPRTLALSMYGDLESSVLDERPPGRGVVKTKWVRGVERRKLEPFVAQRVAAGERAYWVVPRIGEGEDSMASGDVQGAVSAESRFDALSRSRLAEFGVELVHGRLPSGERAARLERFRSGAVRTLVATTVIEVGVDVPEATVMVIEGAERLGLAQLHQIRGRIGRGARDSWCAILGAPSGAERFTVLERTDDGFEIAEEDLRQRGMGDLAGLRQAGLNLEGLAGIGADPLLFEAARRIVTEDERAFEHYRALAASNAPAATP